MEILWRVAGNCTKRYIKDDRPRRSMDRTLACEAENPGSTPGGSTKQNPQLGILCFWFRGDKITP